MFKKTGDVIIQGVLHASGETLVSAVKPLKSEWEQPYIKPAVFESEELCIYVVDGPYVRKTYTPDFNVGGHGYVHDFIPKTEIWLDSAVTDATEMAYTLAHELVERLLMCNPKSPQTVDYETAHTEACRLEKEWRQDGNIATVQSTVLKLIKDNVEAKRA